MTEQTDPTNEPNPPATPRVVTADVVLDAIRNGHTTREDIVEATRLNPSAVGIALTQLHDRGLVTRRQGGFTPGRPGPRRYEYTIADPAT